MRRREENHNLNRYDAAMEVSEPMQQSMSKTSREERVPKAAGMAAGVAGRRRYNHKELTHNEIE